LSSTSNKKKDALRINEIFYSIQGESTWAGSPCVFVRLTYCNLRCRWCDTEYSFFEGNWRSFDDIIGEVKSYGCKLVEVTGGEPLVQENVLPFMQRLCDEGFTVLLETGGHMDLSAVDERVGRIVDVKCPGSGESEKMHWPNLQNLRPADQVKFVIADRSDFDYALNVINTYDLATRTTVLLSPVFGELQPVELAQWILETKLPLRMQLQMHKFIWEPDTRGV